MYSARYSTGLGGVVHEVQRFGRALDVGGEPDAELAQLPDVADAARFVAYNLCVADTRVAHGFSERFGAFGRLLGGVPQELDDLYRLGRTLEEVGQVRRGGVVPCLDDDRVVQVLDRGRVVFEHRRDVAQRLDDVVKMHDADGGGLGVLDETPLASRSTASVPSLPHDQVGEIQAPAPDCTLVRVLRGLTLERVEVVPADAAHCFGEASLDLVIVGTDHLADRAVDFCFAQLPALRPRTTVRRRACIHRAVGEQDFQRDDVVDRLAVDHRACAGAVVADHPADGRAAAGGGVGREVQALGFEVCVELVADDARLDAGPALVGVDLQHVVHVLGAVGDHARAEHLGGQARAAAAHRDRHPEFRRDTDRGDHVGLVFGHDHAGGRHLVVAAVGGVDATADHVGVDLTPHSPSFSAVMTAWPGYLTFAGSTSTLSPHWQPPTTRTSPSAAPNRAMVSTQLTAGRRFNADSARLGVRIQLEDRAQIHQRQDLEDRPVRPGDKHPSAGLVNLPVDADQCADARRGRVADARAVEDDPRVLRDGLLVDLLAQCVGAACVQVAGECEDRHTVYGLLHTGLHRRRVRVEYERHQRAQPCRP